MGPEALKPEHLDRPPFPTYIQLPEAVRPVQAELPARGIFYENARVPALP